MKTILNQIWQTVRILFNRYPILLVPAVLLIFILVSLGGDLIADIDFGCEWKIVTPPPAKPLKILWASGVYIGDPVDLYILAEDEKIYSIVPGSDQWSLASAVPNYSVCGGATGCNWSTSKFSPRNRPFSESVECVEARGCIDAPIPVSQPPSITIVLDQDGTLWYCTQQTTNLDYVLCVPRIWVCSVTGLLVGFYLFVSRSRALKNKTPSKDNYSSIPNTHSEYLSVNDPEKIQYWGPKVYQCPNCSKFNHIRDGNYCMACKTRLADSDVIDNPFLSFLNI